VTPVGFPIPDWSPRLLPPVTPIEGIRCRVEPLDPDRHAADLFDANRLDTEDENWTYLPYGPFSRPSAYRAWLESTVGQPDPQFHAIVDLETQRAVGVAAYQRIDPEWGVIEVGHLNFSPLLQRTPSATEAMWLMMRRAFDELGYRRYEWKCDALNAPSRRAAERLGFTFEGVFRQAAIYKGRNRDTAWYSIIDREWPMIDRALRHWLEPSNFEDGRQLRRLADLR
jgi:RimJ/RimL family protein N-acetyltransferase